jgi:uncharacterized damage-inducible protein DinB
VSRDPLPAPAWSADPGLPLRRMARAAALANARLGAACEALPPGAWEAPRPAFFPSLRLTLEHLLDAERWYAEQVWGAGFDVARGDRGDPAAFGRERREVDLWWVAAVEALAPADLDRAVTIGWDGPALPQALGSVLLHLFLHGVHHRGQAHALLTHAGAAPPQLDEFDLDREPALRAADLAGFGWDEARLRA